MTKECWSLEFELHCPNLINRSYFDSYTENQQIFGTISMLVRFLCGSQTFLVLLLITSRVMPKLIQWLIEVSFTFHRFRRLNHPLLRTLTMVCVARPSLIVHGRSGFTCTRYKYIYRQKICNCIHGFRTSSRYRHCTSSSWALPRARLVMPRSCLSQRRPKVCFVNALAATSYITQTFTASSIILQFSMAMWLLLPRPSFVL